MANPVQTKTASGSATTVAVTLTTPAVAGDLLVMVANGVNALNTPAGFTIRKSFVGDQGFYIWEKTAVGGETTINVIQAAVGNLAATLIELDKAVVQAFDTGSVVTGFPTQSSLAVSSTTGTDVDGDYCLCIVALHGWTTAPAFGSVNNGFASLVSNVPAGSGATQMGHIIAYKDKANGAVGVTTLNHTNVVDNNAGFQLTWGLVTPVVVPVGSKTDTEFARLIAAGFGPGSVRDMQDKELSANPTTSITDRRYAAWAGSGSMIEKSIAGGKNWVDVDDTTD